MKYLAALYVTVMMFAVFAAVELWPISNFSAFRAATDFSRMSAFRWVIADKVTGSQTLVKYRFDQSCASFSHAVETLHALNQPVSPGTLKFMKNYIRGELRIMGYFPDNYSVTVYRYSMTRSPYIPPKFLPARCLNDRAGQKWCLAENEFASFDL